MITDEKAIEALQKRLEALNKISESQRFNEWKTRTLQTLAHIYGEKHTSYSALKGIHSFQYSDRTADAKSEASELLNGLISDIENFGLPHLTEKNNTDALSFNVHQHNEQNQSTQVSINFEFIVEVLKGELRTSEIDELKEILEADIESKEKKKSFMEKIKSFGSDVASNILANILTNPQVYEQIGKML
ncbi:hypothetical protein [Flavobacterium xueshanense]|uniref:Uncharacterized protein n=1 Tax=Flavobacterium xueshanense TaxID=935223 RepID=A0A1I2EBZ0_9FLAO|nr:hypothetical protein [Flavobacterium xueshanense]SFE90239.1 hypothetical protein SAMN04488131_105157 [Flavobacterium xueshanense]